MGISIYYSARRSTPLSSSEQKAIESVDERFSVDEAILRYCETGEGPNWESFCVYDPNDEEPDVIFAGATGLPDNSEEALWQGLQHWCSALTEIRRALKDTEWDVAVDDHEIAWDEETEMFDPSV